MAGPLVNVYMMNGERSDNQISLPSVFKTPIRPDIISKVADEMRKNTRQPYGVSKTAGVKVSAHSWGTGRAMARIPRVSGSGTGRASQGAYGNMCRGGHMFGGTKIFRRWYRKINLKQKRYAICSAIAASGVSSLVMAKGHRVEEIPEFPLVVDNDVENLLRTKDAVNLLKKLNAYPDVEKVIDTKRIRPGRGKMRNRRHVLRRGPLVIYKEDNGITKAFRNLPGVELLPVEKLNLRVFAPGGHVGRFVIWTKSAMETLDALYGTWTSPSSMKVDWNLPQPIMSITDLKRILRSEEVQSAVNDPLTMKSRATEKRPRKINPLKNKAQMERLNPQLIAIHKLRGAKK
uniref:Ribosomal protein L4 n=1 Tax=Dicyema japonicum TaxID=399803 RepID=B9ZYX6_DICJA|nr:ribosomal protein L4 [Dicyema japonicum]